jgi:hypothetical protein
VTVIWTAVVSFIAFKLVDIFIGLRVPEDEEREGLTGLAAIGGPWHSDHDERRAQARRSSFWRALRRRTRCGPFRYNPRARP